MVSQCLNAIPREARTAARAARGYLHTPTTMYPSWTVADVIRHLGQIHRWVQAMVAERAKVRASRPDVSMVADTELLNWLVDGADELTEVLAGSDPQTPMWAFGEPQNVGFWLRRMALETAIHRWDIQEAVGTVTPSAIDNGLAALGVTEALDIYLVPGLTAEQVNGAGEHVQLECIDGARWSIILQSAGVEVGSGSAEPDVKIRGTASALWLFVMGRRSLNELQVEGDVAAAVECERLIRLVRKPT